MSAITGILTALKLAEAIASTASAIPSPPSDLTQKHRWQTLTVVNQTQFPLSLVSTFFDSGRFWTAPTIVQSFNEMTFSVCNKDTSFFTGASGAIALQADVAEGLVCNIGVGFSTPEAGPFSANVAFDADFNQQPNAGPVLPLGDFTQGTYNANSSGLVTTQSTTYTGTDTNGNATTIQFKGVSAPGQEAMITITEVITSGGN